MDILEAANANTNAEILIKRIGDILNSGITVTGGGGGGVTPNSSINHGRKTVAVAGVSEPIASSTPCVSVTIQAEFDNTGVIVVGGVDVVADLGTRDGIALSPEDSITVNIDDLSKVYIDSTVSTDGVTFVYFN